MTNNKRDQKGIFHNKTKQSASIPKTLIKKRKLHLLPIYYLLKTSKLGAEAIENSGSYIFADHVYGGKPKGRFLLGTLLDKILLSLPSARSMRNRYIHAKKEIHKLLNEKGEKSSELNILMIPSGLAREAFEVEEELKKINHPHRSKLRWHLMDLDEKVTEHLKIKGAGLGLKNMFFYTGDALSYNDYPANKRWDIIISTGFTEFLDDRKTTDFYRLVFEMLEKNGKFFTSGMLPHKLSDYLMKHIAEMHISYRSPNTINKLIQSVGFQNIELTNDEYNIQTMILAKKTNE